jgi:hypothetical protein
MLRIRNLTRILPLTALVGAAGSAVGQWKITDTSIHTIDFDGSVGFNDGIPDNDVMKGPVRLNFLKICEPDNWDYSPFNNGETAFSSLAWAYKFQSIDDQFGDLNGDSDLDDRRDIFQMRGIDSTTLPALGANNRAVMFDAETWDDKWLTLRVKNATGSTVSAWNLGVDLWFNDTAANGGTLRVLTGTQLNALQEVITYNSTNANLGWAGSTFSTPLQATVADGDYLYVRFYYDQNGRGNAFAMDNISIQAVPEPGSLAFLALGVASLARRRRRS